MKVLKNDCAKYVKEICVLLKVAMLVTLSRRIQNGFTSMPSSAGASAPRGSIYGEPPPGEIKYKYKFTRFFRYRTFMALD